MSDPASGLISWFLGDKGQTILAGMFGGVIQSLTLRQGWKEFATNLVAGGICAFYLGPIGIWFLKPFINDSSGQQTFIGFVVGLIGLSITRFILDAWQRRKNLFLEGKNEDDKNVPGNK